MYSCKDRIHQLSLFVKYRLSAHGGRQVTVKCRKQAKVILDQMPFAIVRPNIPAYAPGSREIGLAVEEAVFGNKDPKATLDAAAKKVDAMLK